MAYPDPSQINKTPQPYNPKEVTPSPFAAHIASIWPSTANSSRGYVTLDDYFQLGNANLTNARASTNNGQNDLGATYDSYFTNTSTSSRVSFPGQQRDLQPSPHELSPEPSPRRRGPGRPRGRGGAQRRRGGWKRLIKGTEHAELFKTPRLHRQAGGRDMKPRGKGKAKSRAAVDPGSEFRKLQGQAMEAWMRQDYEAAEQHALDAVMMNPEVYEAHALVSDALLAQGRKFEALLAKHVGAPVAQDADIFIEVADQWLEFYGENQDERYLSWAIDSYREASKIQSTNCDIRRGMRDAYILLNDPKAAKLMSKSIVKLEPEDLDNVQKYAELCAMEADRSEMSKAKIAFEEAFHLNRDKNSVADADTQWTFLNVYIDLLDHMGDYAECAFQLKNKARWFLGRKDENFWDRFTADDREFDSGNDRRNYVWEFQQGRASRDLNLYGDGLPIELRVKLGIVRLKSGAEYNTEAQRHLNHLLHLRDEVETLFDLFTAAAEALKASDLIDAAIDFYEPLRRSPELLSDGNYMALADCYIRNKRNEDAISCYSVLIERDDANVNARVQLAKLYENMGLTDEARKIADEVIEMGYQKTLQRERVLLEKVKRGRKPGGRSTKADGKRRTALETGSTRTPLPRPDAAEVHDSSQAPTAFGMSGQEATARYRFIVPRSVPANAGATLPAISLAGFVQTTATHAGTEVTLSEEPVEMVDVQEPVEQVEEAITTDSDPRHGGNLDAPSQYDPTATPKRAYTKKISRGDEQTRIINEHYQVVKDLWYAVEEDTDEGAIHEWMVNANAMLNVFRSKRSFFSGRMKWHQYKGFRGMGFVDAMDEMEALKDRLKDSTENQGGPSLESEGISSTNQFHEIPFSEWHRIACDLAVLYAKYVNDESCIAIIQDVLMNSTVFRQNAELSNITGAVSMYCGLLFHDDNMLVEAARSYILSSNFRAGMPYQLLATLVRLGDPEGAAYRDGNLAKFILRSVRMHDYAAMSEEMRAQTHWGDVWEAKRLKVWMANRRDDEKDELDAGVLSIHGHILSSTKTGRYGPGGFSNAMMWLFRAFALQPENCMLNLSIAVTFLKSATYRTVVNRQQAIGQGLAFLYRYYDLRVADQKACHIQEAEYNMARLWHQLGLMHLAVKGYQKVLDMSADVQRDMNIDDIGGGHEIEDFAKEAAFALQGLLALAGNTDAARRITEEWLVM